MAAGSCRMPAPAMAQLDFSLSSLPVAPSPQALPGRAPLSPYPGEAGSVPLVPASWGPPGVDCPLLTDGDPLKPHVPPGAQCLADPAPVGGRGGRGAQGAPSSDTHPSSLIPSEPGHRAALHRVHDCHHPSSEVTHGQVLPLRRCSFMSPPLGLSPRVSPGCFSRRGRCSCTG